MKVPKKTPSDASNIHGLPCISSTIPQPMKQVNSRNTRMASANFITADCSRFARTRKPGGCGQCKTPAAAPAHIPTPAAPASRARATPDYPPVTRAVPGELPFPERAVRLRLCAVLWAAMLETPVHKTVSRNLGKIKSGLPNAFWFRRQPVILCRRNNFTNSISVDLFPCPRILAINRDLSL